MKLKDTFISYNVGDDNILVSLDTKLFSGIVNSNETASFIIDCLKNETCKTELVKAVLERYEDVDELRAAKGVDYVLDQLRSIEALEE
jgi:hypothetical protein